MQNDQSACWVVVHLHARGIPDGERYMTAANGGGSDILSLISKCVGQLAGWLFKIGEKVFSYGVTHFGG